MYFVFCMVTRENRCNVAIDALCIVDTGTEGSVYPHKEYFVNVYSLKFFWMNWWRF